MYWFAATTAPEGARVDDDLDDDLDDVAAQFAGWHDPIPSLIAATPRNVLLGHDIYHLATPLPAYAVGRVALLGDAAHALTPDLGQGAGQALEDAVTLTAYAADGDDVVEALARYDRARRPRTQDLVRASARIGRFANAGHAFTAALRDVAAWLLPASAYLRASADTFSWQPPSHPLADDALTRRDA